MPPAENSPSRSLHAGAFKEPAAFKWLSSSLDAAQLALVELRADAGRDLSHGARDLHKDLRTFITNARRDSARLAKALQRDFERAQQQLAQDPGSGRAARDKATTPPASRSEPANTERTATRRVSARAARASQTRTPNTDRRGGRAATPTGAARASASSRAPEGRAGTRRDQLLALVVDQPGITLAQAAAQFGLKDATGLYAAARRLQSDGLVRKDGAKLHPIATTHATSAR